MNFNYTILMNFCAPSATNQANQFRTKAVRFIKNKSSTFFVFVIMLQFHYKNSFFNAPYYLLSGFCMNYKNRSTYNYCITFTTTYLYYNKKFKRVLEILGVYVAWLGVTFRYLNLSDHLFKCFFCLLPYLSFL